MVKAVSIHIGLNAVDPAHYGGSNGALSSCEADAEMMHGICAQAGYQATRILTEYATRKNVADAILEQAKSMQSGDTLVISYAGHGSQVPDPTDEETDYADETWCLYDGQQLDDERFRLWQQFKVGVRIILISDSCHSETVARALFMSDDPDTTGIASNTDLVSRALPARTMFDTYRLNKTFYDSIKRGKKAQLGCGVLTLSACRDDQEAHGNRYNGYFTSAFRNAFSEEQLMPGYAIFVGRINTLVSSDIRALQEARMMVDGNCTTKFLNGPILGY